MGVFLKSVGKVILSSVSTEWLVGIVWSYSFGVYLSAERYFANSCWWWLLCLIIDSADANGTLVWR